MGNKREIGVAAKNQKSSNHDNTISNLKKAMIELRNDDHSRSQENCYKIQLKNEETMYLHIVQVIAMLFSKLKADANAALFPDIVTECVLAVPSYFSPLEQNIVLFAAGIAGLSCRFLIKETTALAIEYGFYKTFPSEKIIIFIDFGHISIQICACRFSETRIETLAEAHEMIGGKDIDTTLATHFLKDSHYQDKSEEFQSEFRDEVEKLKIKMSANTEKLPLSNAQHLIGSETPLSMQRSQMEAVCGEIFEKITKFFRTFLDDCEVEIRDVNSIEITGGSSRIPAFKRIVEEVFEKPPREALSQDVAISKGCFLRNVMARKKKNIGIIEKPLRRGSTLPGFLPIEEVRGGL